MTGKQLVLKAVYDRSYSLMECSINGKLVSDELYLTDDRNTTELKDRYEALPLTKEHRFVINDYTACNTSRLQRAMELAYLAGVETVLRILSEQVA